MMFYDILFGKLTTVDRENTARCIALLNRAVPAMSTYMKYKMTSAILPREFGQELIKHTEEILGQALVYKDGMAINYHIIPVLTEPGSTISYCSAEYNHGEGDMIYSEVVRDKVRKLDAYVEEMSKAEPATGEVNIHKVQDDVMKLWTTVKTQPEIRREDSSKSAV
jgi:fatty acid synthase subunit alpha, fungi type